MGNDSWRSCKLMVRTLQVETPSILEALLEYSTSEVASKTPTSSREYRVQDESTMNLWGFRVYTWPPYTVRIFLSLYHKLHYHNRYPFFIFGHRPFHNCMLPPYNLLGHLISIFNTMTLLGINFQRFIYYPSPPFIYWVELLTQFCQILMVVRSWHQSYP